MTEETESEAKGTEKQLDKMTVKELREIAKQIDGVTGVHAMKKDELLSLVKKDSGVEEEKPKAAATKKKKASTKKLEPAKGVKALIAQLRKEKAEAKKAKDRNTVDRLRKKIKRLKKQIAQLPKAA